LWRAGHWKIINWLVSHRATFERDDDGIDQDSPPKPILFLAQSVSLVERMESDWNVLCEVNGIDGASVSFLCIETLLKKCFRARGLTVMPATVGYVTFESYFEENKNTFISKAFQGKQAKKKSNMAAVLEKQTTDLLVACKIPDNIRAQDKEMFVCQALYQELCLLAPSVGYGDEAAAIFSKSSSYFDHEGRPQLAERLKDILQAYRKQMESEISVDPKLSVLAVPEGAPFHSYLIFDEAQNASVNEVQFSALMSENTILLANKNQNTHSSKSSFTLQKQLLGRIKDIRDIPVHHLRKSYRCSVAVNRAARPILQLRDNLADISPQEIFLNEDQEKGAASFYAETDELMQEIRATLAPLNKTQVVIVSQADEAHVQRLFPGCIVLQPGKVPGLEFDTVVLYCPLEGASTKSLIQSANEKLVSRLAAAGQKTAKEMVPYSDKHATAVGDPRFTKLFQNLYMTITRAVKQVVVIQSKKVFNEAIVESWVTQGFSVDCVFDKKKNISSSSTSPVVVPEIATQEQWEHRLRDMMRGGRVNHKQIKTLVQQHLYQDIDKKARFQKFIGPKAAVNEKSQPSDSFVGELVLVAPSKPAESQELVRLVKDKKNQLTSAQRKKRKNRSNGH
jgi:hypothetical protein